MIETKNERLKEKRSLPPRAYSAKLASWKNLFFKRNRAAGKVSLSYGHASENCLDVRRVHVGGCSTNENPSGLGVMKYNNRFPGQYYDEETGTHYNYFRDYDPSLGRYIESDPIGLKAGLSTYGYVFSRPLTGIDLRGLATFEGFSPGDEAKMRQALEDAKEKLSKCRFEDCERTRDDLNNITKKMDNANYVFDPSSPYCGSANRFPIFPNTITLGGSAFSFQKCCDLSSTVAHEANHLRNSGSSGSEGASRKLEKDCFNCPRASQ